jgi:hypothetical protein
VSDPYRDRHPATGASRGLRRDTEHMSNPDIIEAATLRIMGIFAPEGTTGARNADGTVTVTYSAWTTTVENSTGRWVEVAS